MKARCERPSHKAFAHYGARGVSVCDRWRSSFECFLADMGPRPPGHTLDRLDNSGNYEPGNVRWATPLQQTRNRSSTVLLTLHGVTKSAQEWAAISGLSRSLIYSRLRNGWSDERTLTAPYLRRSAH